MVWLDSGRSNQTAVSAFVADFLAHNITVGAIDIDSAWSTGFNNFVVDTTKFPDMSGLVAGLHAQSIRTILWATSMVDTDSSNFAEASARNYMIHDGFNQTAMLTWWHGTGGLLDYTNLEARSWWEGQLDNVLSPSTSGGGIDGWKCDGTDPYIIELLTPKTSDGSPITYPEYANLYYGHFFNYTRTINPESLIWSRPVDSPSQIGGLNISIFLAYSPHYVMFSGWVGDQDPDFNGLRAAGINILESAWQGYVNFASDTGGYRDGPRTRETLLRWSQLNAFLPLFENGGNGEHRPWAYDTAPDTSTTDVYRRLVAAHYELAPYLLSTGTAAFAAGNVSAITPVSPPPFDFPFIIQPDDITDWSYALGPTVFASPIFYEGQTSANVTLPTSEWAGRTAARFGDMVSTSTEGSWADYWNPANVYPAGSNFLYPAPLTGVPADQQLNAVFSATGSILPLHVSTHLGNVRQGHAAWAAALTLVMHDLPRVEAGGEGVSARLRMRDASEEGLEVSAVAHVREEPEAEVVEVVEVTASAYDRPLILVLRRSAGSKARAGSPFVRLVSSRGAIPLPQREAEPSLAGRVSPPLALSFDSTARDGGRYPAGDRHVNVRAAFEEELSGSFSYARAQESPSGTEELVVYIGAEDALSGARVRIEW
jgi:hypothetical protein